MKTCPKCKTTHESETQSCACGFDFINPVLANRGDRYLAYMLDTLIAFIPLVLLVTSSKEKALANLGLMIFLGYYFLSDGLLKGQSLGKRLLKIKVVGLNPSRPCSLIQSVLRNVTHLLGMLDWIWIFGEKRTRLGDVIARTQVISLKGTTIK